MRMRFIITAFMRNFTELVGPGITLNVVLIEKIGCNGRLQVFQETTAARDTLFSTQVRWL